MTKRVIVLLTVAVMFSGLVPGLNAQVTLLDEDFEGSYLPTGWAQINGWRGETNTVYKMRKRIEFELEYMRE